MAGPLQVKGYSVPALELGAEHFVDKTTVLYGPSKTGKTVFVKHILWLTRRSFDQVLIVSPTEVMNSAYRGIVPPQLILERPWKPDPRDPGKDDGHQGTVRFLTDILERQQHIVSAAGRAGRPAALRRLFRRLLPPGRQRAERMLARMARKRAAATRSIEQRFAAGRRDRMLRRIAEKDAEVEARLYRSCIGRETDRLWRLELDADERFSLKHLRLNPRLLLVFDDCADELKRVFQKEIFRKIFYKGRHYQLTVVLTCQDDTDVCSNLRKNAFLSVYTSEIVCVANFERASNKYPARLRKYVREIAPELFRDYRMLLYLREDETRRNLYHVKVPESGGFTCCSEAVWELCRRVKAEEEAPPPSGRFGGLFDD